MVDIGEITTYYFNHVAFDIGLKYSRRSKVLYGNSSPKKNGLGFIGSEILDNSKFYLFKLSQTRKYLTFLIVFVLISPKRELNFRTSLVKKQPTTV
jgi:hypothetical protein